MPEPGKPTSDPFGPGAAGLHAARLDGAEDLGTVRDLIHAAHYGGAAPETPEVLRALNAAISAARACFDARLLRLQRAHTPAAAPLDPTRALQEANRRLRRELASERDRRDRALVLLASARGRITELEGRPRLLPGGSITLRGRPTHALPADPGLLAAPAVSADACLWAAPLGEGPWQRVGRSDGGVTFTHENDGSTSAGSGPIGDAADGDRPGGSALAALPAAETGELAGRPGADEPAPLVRGGAAAGDEPGDPRRGLLPGLVRPRRREQRETH